MNSQKTLPADFVAMSAAAKLFTKSALMGMDGSVRHYEFEEIPDIEDIENLPFTEAVEYLKKRSVLSKVDYEKLSDKLRFRAFTASRIADGDLLKRINAELIKNVDSGDGLKSFLSMTKDELLSKVGMGANQGWYWETVYRTNVQTAYNVGRAMAFEQDKPLAYELIAIDDSRTTDICRPYATKRVVLASDDPFWKTHWPPFHFNCRTTVRAIYDESELPEHFESVQDVPSTKGFGEYPLNTDSWWQELESQSARAKDYGIQEEIEEARKILINKVQTQVSDFVSVKNIKSANKYAKKTLGILHADYKGVSIEAANEWNKGLFENFKKFPELKERFGFVGECHARNIAMKNKFYEIKTKEYLEKFRIKESKLSDIVLKPYVKRIVSDEWKIFSKYIAISKETIAQSYSPISGWQKEFAGITTNKDIVKNYSNYLKIAERNVANKYHPVGTASLKADLDHEIGHQLDSMLDIRKDTVIFNLWKNLTPNQVTNGLSEYAWNNSNPQPIGEFIAEAWSEYCNNSTPRFIAKTVGDRILEIYKLWKK